MSPPPRARHGSRSAGTASHESGPATTVCRNAHSCPPWTVAALRPLDASRANAFNEVFTAVAP